MNRKTQNLLDGKLLSGFYGLTAELYTTDLAYTYRYAPFGETKFAEQTKSGI